MEHLSVVAVMFHYVAQAGLRLVILLQELPSAGYTEMSCTTTLSWWQEEFNIL